MTEEKKELFLLDAYALIFRSYYAFIRNPRINSKGQNTSAIFGFVLTLDEILNRRHPSHIAVVFDPPSPTFRHEMYKEYKANRDATPEDIKMSVPYIKKILEAYRIPVYEVEGYEADDVIGTMSKRAERMGLNTYMMTPDKDFAQLVSERIRMYKPARGGNDPVIWGPEEVKEEFMIKDPLQVIDILALMGDAADNIPGAPGIGPKTAKKLISEFGSVENLISNSATLKGKQKEIIENNSEQIMFSKKLVTIETKVPVDFTESDLLKKDPDGAKLMDIYRELEFRTMATKISQSATNDTPGATAGASNATTRSSGLQTSLFDEPSGEAEVRQFSTIDSTPHDYRLLSSTTEIVKLADDLNHSGSFCFDTETTSLNALDTELVAIAFSWEAGKGYLVHFDGTREETIEKIKPLVKPLENPAVGKTGQNLKFDIQVLHLYGINVKGPLFDTMLAHYLLEPDMRHKMDWLAETYLNYKPVAIETLIGEKGKNQGSMRNVSAERITEYAVEDADITWQLKKLFEPKLAENDMVSLATDIEMPLIPVLADMEEKGITLDEESLNSYAKILREDIIVLEKEIHELAGTEFNISSPRQLGEILFVRLKLDDKAKRTKTKQFSTNEEVLQRLAGKHPIIEKVLDYRGLRKLLSTYVEALPLMINRRTGRIHTSYNQAVTATGRLSSNNPNLQNIPIRDSRGREIRKAFIPGKGRQFLSADYSQIELRLMAHLSKDKGMIDDFLAGEDIHSATAAKIFGVGPGEVTREMRSKAKTANFGIIYGISAFGLSQRLNIPRSEAKELIEGYFASYPGVKSYMDRSIEEARGKGYVTTMFGRRRWLRDITSRNALLRSNAERNAINAPIQGSAADIIKIAMINIYNTLAEKNIEADMLLQVHDELIFETGSENVAALKQIVIKCMEEAASLSVPLVVDCGTGSDWLEAH